MVAAGWIDFEDAFLRLAKTQFRLSGAVVESLRERISQRGSDGA